jgi:hypothetical protein
VRRTPFAKRLGLADRPSKGAASTASRRPSNRLSPPAPGPPRRRTTHGLKATAVPNGLEWRKPARVSALRGSEETRRVQPRSNAFDARAVQRRKGAPRSLLSARQLETTPMRPVDADATRGCSGSTSRNQPRGAWRMATVADLANWRGVKDSRREEQRSENRRPTSLKFLPAIRGSLQVKGARQKYKLSLSNSYRFGPRVAPASSEYALSAYAMPPCFGTRDPFRLARR